MGEGPGRALRVSVVYCPGPGVFHEWHLQLSPGMTVRDAVAASGFFELAPALRPQPLDCGVWGRAAPPAQLLRDMDRIEILRPLRVDPKIARRERFKRQGARATGLFARKPAAGR